MEKRSVIEALRAVAADESRPETAKLREIFDEVEAALEAGASREKVLAALHNEGFKMSLRGFDTALYRIRKQRQSKAQNMRNSVQGTRLPPLAATGEREEEQQQQASQSDDLTGLSSKERREKRADQFIKSESTNPLVKRLKENK